jgi:hypothetical protein
MRSSSAPLRPAYLTYLALFIAFSFFNPTITLEIVRRAAIQNTSIPVLFEPV